MEGALTLRRNTAGVEEEKGGGLAGGELARPGQGYCAPAPGASWRREVSDLRIPGRGASF